MTREKLGRLLYPGAMGACPRYFWELYDDEVERFDEEEKCEARIRELLTQRRCAIASAP